MPDTVYENMDFDLNGKKITKDEICKNDDSICPPLQKTENIVGRSMNMICTRTVVYIRDLHMHITFHFCAVMLIYSAMSHVPLNGVNLLLLVADPAIGSG